MGISTRGHKRTPTGAKCVKTHKKRKCNMGRQPANTKIGELRVIDVRCRGGNIKKRAMRLDTGKFALLSSGFETVVPMETVVHHPASNEMMRTNTITCGAVVSIPSEPYAEKLAAAGGRCAQDAPLHEMASRGHLYAKVTSRPGQTGEASGYVLQGAELNFFLAKIKQKKKIK